jgi:hypothetical protein
VLHVCHALAMQYSYAALPRVENLAIQILGYLPFDIVIPANVFVYI